MGKCERNSIRRLLRWSSIQSERIQICLLWNGSTISHLSAIGFLLSRQSNLTRVVSCDFSWEVSRETGRADATKRSLMMMIETDRSLVFSSPSSSSQLTSHTNHPTDKNQFRQKNRIEQTREIINGNFTSWIVYGGLEIRRFRKSSVCSVTRFNYTQKAHFFKLESVSKQL